MTKFFHSISLIIVWAAELTAKWHSAIAIYFNLVYNLFIHIKLNTFKSNLNLNSSYIIIKITVDLLFNRSFSFMLHNRITFTKEL